MSSYVFINRLQPKDGQRGQLIELLREFATSINQEPGASITRFTTRSTTRPVP